MNKYEFLYKLNKGLVNMPDAEKKEVTRYYDELIQDAIDNHEDEAAFINRLGSIDTIIRTLQKDTSFVNNVKEKKNFELRKVFNITSKLIGFFIYGLIIIIVGSMAFSFAGSGLAVLFYGGSQLVIGLQNSVSSSQIMFNAGQTLMGIGLFMLSVTMFWWLVKKSKGIIEKLIEWIQSTTEKIGDNE